MYLYHKKIKQKAIWYRCGSKLEQLSVEKLALAGYFFFFVTATNSTQIWNIIDLGTLLQKYFRKVAF